MKYYMTQRPPQPGAMPRKGLVDIEDFSGRVYCAEIARAAYARLTYDRELTAEEISDYELVKEG